MANLSNINGKFVVEQTTGYVGVGTTDPNFLIEAAGVNSEIALNSTSGSIYRVRSTSSDAFIITKNGVGDRLVIDGSGNSTFAGTITSGALIVGTSGTSRFTDTSAFPLQLNRGLAVDVVGTAGTIFGLGAYSTGTTYIDAVRIVGVLDANGTDGDMQLQVLNSGTHTTALTLNNNNDATFAGNVIAEGSLITRSVNANVTISGDTSGNIYYNNASGEHRWRANGSSVNSMNLSSTLLTVNENATFTGTGTFAGNVTLAKAVGDTELLIEADTNNNNENYNPRLHLRQDGGAISAYFGLNGDADNTFTGALANGAYIRAAGSIQFANGSGTDLAMTIDTSQNVGIGTTSPTAKLHIYGGASGATVSGNSNLLAIETNGNNGIQFLNPTANNANINFGDPNNNENGFIQYQHSGDAMRFRAGGTTILNLVNGRVGIGEGSPDNKLEVAGGINYNNKLVERMGGRNGTGTYTLFTNGSSTTQSTGTVEIAAIYQTPSTSAIWKYKISGNRSAPNLIWSETTGYNGSAPTISWNGATLEVSNSNGSTYYTVVVRLFNIGNSWSPTWGNLPGISN